MKVYVTLAIYPLRGAVFSYHFNTLDGTDRANIFKGALFPLSNSKRHKNS